MHLYSIGDMAQKSHTTIETLRHYDRIGLLKPACVAAGSGYRYYSSRELLTLLIIQYCKRRGASLKEISALLHQEDPAVFLSFFQESEKKIDEEIAFLKKEKDSFRALRREYELQIQLFSHPEEPRYSLSEMPVRHIFLSQSLSDPTPENFCLLEEEIRRRASCPCKLTLDPGLRRITWFTPEGKVSRLFSICRRCSPLEPEVRTLPSSRYLIRSCPRDKLEEASNELLRVAREEYQSSPDFLVQSVVFTGISRWDYRLEVPLDRSRL